MNGQILRLGGDEHDIVQLLLPWYDSGHLDPVEVARVQAHLGTCARCQADIAWQRRVGELARAEPEASHDAPDVDRGWAALRAQVLTQQASQPSPSARSTQPVRRWPSFGWRWLVGLQSTVIVGLAALVIVLLVPRVDNYRALGQPSQAGAASIVVVFRPEASEVQIRQALRDSDARLVDGPTVTGAYLLSVAPERHAQALGRLRAAGSVLRVDSLAAEPVR